MAALAADIAAIFDPRWDIGLVQRPATGADTYYRGGIASSIVGTGLLTLTPVDADFYAGVVMEHKVVAAASELVWIGSAGRWFFTAAELKLADTNLPFSLQATDLFDNPATMDTNGAADVGTIGILWLCTNDAQDGWLNTDMRTTITNN